MQPVFNFSSASHSLLSVFRALSGAHGAAIAAKSKDAVAEQLAVLLPQAQQLGAVCVPTLPAHVRDAYTKQVLVVQGLVALTSAVARNVTAMLPQVGSVLRCISAEPALHVLQQAACCGYLSNTAWVITRNLGQEITLFCAARALFMLQMRICPLVDFVEHLGVCMSWPLCAAG